MYRNRIIKITKDSKHNTRRLQEENGLKAGHSRLSKCHIKEAGEEERKRLKKKRIFIKIENNGKNISLAKTWNTFQNNVGLKRSAIIFE